MARKIDTLKELETYDNLKSESTKLKAEAKEVKEMGRVIEINLIILVIGLFALISLLILGYKGIKYLQSKTSKQDERAQSDQPNNSSQASSSTSGKVDNGAVSTSRTDSQATKAAEKIVRQKTGYSKAGLAKSQANQDKMRKTGVWHKTDYKKGDILSGKYTIQKGDTLWEISEGYYGKGTDWTKILNKNFSKIKYLPNGQHALIIPGQVLLL